MARMERMENEISEPKLLKEIETLLNELKHQRKKFKKTIVNERKLMEETPDNRDIFSSIARLRQIKKTLQYVVDDIKVFNSDNWTTKDNYFIPDEE